MDIRLIITNISQKIGVFSIVAVGVDTLSWAASSADGVRFQAERSDEAHHAEDYAELRPVRCDDRSSPRVLAIGNVVTMAPMP